MSEEVTRGLHVFTGAIFALPRRMWNPQTLEACPLDWGLYANFAAWHQRRRVRRRPEFTLLTSEQGYSSSAGISSASPFLALAGGLAAREAGVSRLTRPSAPLR